MSKNYFYGTILIFFLFIGVNRFLNLQSKSLDNIASCFMYPVIMVQYKIIEPVRSWWLQKHSYAEINKLLKHYIERNEALQSQIIELNAALDYNEKTTDLVAFSKRYKTDKAVLAQILFKSFGDKNNLLQEKADDKPLHFYLIDAGKNKGITTNMIAVYKNCLVGRVSEVYPYYSKVTLITDKLCKVAAYCAKNKVQGIHEGSNDLKTSYLTFVNNLDLAANGDMVLSSGEGLIFPKGFGLATVKNFDNLNQTITVEPMLNFNSLDYCYILEKGSELIEENIEEGNPSSILNKAKSEQ